MFFGPLSQMSLRPCLMFVAAFITSVVWLTEGCPLPILKVF